MSFNKVALIGFALTGLSLSYQPANAQLLYPPVSEQRGISVTGQGRANVPADQARIDVLLTNRDPNEPPNYGAPSPDGMPSTPPFEPKPITREGLEEVQAALLGAGLPESAIMINLPTVDTVSYGYRRAEASLNLALEQPTQTQVNDLIKLINDTLKEASPTQTIFVSTVFVQYAINSCELVEQQAYSAAMEDAQLRARAIADAINVTLIEPPAVAELPFVGRFLSPCNEDTDVIGALFWSPDSNIYNPEAPSEVVVYRELMVTYPVE